MSSPTKLFFFPSIGISEKGAWPPQDPDPGRRSGKDRMPLFDSQTDRAPQTFTGPRRETGGPISEVDNAARELLLEVLEALPGAVVPQAGGGELLRLPHGGLAEGALQGGYGDGAHAEVPEAET